MGRPGTGRDKGDLGDHSREVTETDRQIDPSVPSETGTGAWPSLPVRLLKIYGGERNRRALSQGTVAHAHPRSRGRLRVDRTIARVATEPSGMESRFPAARKNPSKLHMASRMNSIVEELEQGDNAQPRFAGVPSR
jgi:hypothetical protein